MVSFFRHITNALRDTFHFIFNPVRRMEMLTTWKYGDKYFQRSVFTLPDRYPLLFDQCRLLLQDRTETKILSYGCSTGEEVISLGSYLPAAHIMGVDINPNCIRVCNERNSNPLHVFCGLQDKLFLQAGSFDAIFCMAVFQRIENRDYLQGKTATGFSFEIFEAEIGKLHRKLRIGGYFFITYSDFAFQDTCYMHLYAPVRFEGNMKVIKRSIYGRDNRIKGGTQYLYRCFVKKAD